VRLDAETWDDKGRTVVELSGELDLFTAPVLRDVLLRLTGDGKHFLAVEMSGLRFLDSSGLGVLVGATKRAVAGGGGLCLVGAPQRMLKTLTITGLLRVMPAFTSLEDAFAWLDRLHASRAAAHGASGNGAPSSGG
jgi:anti-sigma B factor antagonist